MTYVTLLLPDGQVLSVQGVKTAKYAAKEVAVALRLDPDRPWELFGGHVGPSADFYPRWKASNDELLSELAEGEESPLVVTIGVEDD